MRDIIQESERGPEESIKYGYVTVTGNNNPFTEVRSVGGNACWNRAHGWRKTSIVQIRKSVMIQDTDVLYRFSDER